MIIEIVVVDVIAGSEAAFEAGAAEAAPLFLADPTCHSFQVLRSIEVAGRYHLRVEWDSVAAHEQFRTTPSFARWRELVGGHFAKPPVVEHGAIVVSA